MGRFDNWSPIEYIAGDAWHFYPAPSGGAIAYGRGGLFMSPDMAQEIFEALQCFFDFHGREKVQMLCDRQADSMCTHLGTEAPSILQHLYPEEYAQILAQRSGEGPKIITLTEPDRAGFVYVLLADNWLCKIGRTKDFGRRLLQLESGLPYDLEPLAVIKTEDMYRLEEMLHEMFASKRKKGEWFDLEAEDIEYLKGLANG